MEKLEVTSEDFMCIDCFAPCWFGMERCPNCGRKLPPAHGAMYMKEWPEDEEE